VLLELTGVAMKKKQQHVFMELHFKTKDLTEYLLLLEEAKRRDHRKWEGIRIIAFSQK
jgi:threonyl-tRNA synthetase